jgi:phenylacetic acid degradation operon negative regulatory protein
MHPKTEELLYLMLWGAETLTRPTFRNLTDSYEQWAYRRGFLYQLQRLEQRKFLEKKHGTVERIYRLTEAGRITALGGLDPEARWHRPWDGKWRMVVYDLPEPHNSSRVRLRRFLKESKFGYLQKSLWITPDPLQVELKKLSANGENVECLLTLDASPCSGEADESIVTGGWDFARINRLYQECIGILKAALKRKDGETMEKSKLQHWARQERAAWQAALSADPLLPERLLPSNYLGLEAWKLRNAVLREALNWIR